MSDLWVMLWIVAVFALCAGIGSRLREGGFGQTVLMFVATVCMMALICVQWQL